MANDTEDRFRRIAALGAFLEANRNGLKNALTWTKEAGVSYNALNEPLGGKKLTNHTIEILEKLADAAARLLKRPVSVDELIGRGSEIPNLEARRERLKAVMAANRRGEVAGCLDDLPHGQANGFCK